MESPEKDVCLAYLRLSKEVGEAAARRVKGQERGTKGRNTGEPGSID